MAADFLARQGGGPGMAADFLARQATGPGMAADFLARQADPAMDQLDVAFKQAQVAPSVSDFEHFMAQPQIGMQPSVRYSLPWAAAGWIIVQSARCKNPSL